MIAALLLGRSELYSTCDFWCLWAMQLLRWMVGWSLAGASCVLPTGTIDGVRRGLPHRTVATVEDDDAEAEVFGPPTPPAVAVGPLRDLQETLNTLWDDGEEHTIYMLEGFFRNLCVTTDAGPGTPEWQAWEETRRFGEQGDPGLLTPWWRMWTRRLLERWRTWLLRDEGEEGDMEEVQLMQQKASPGDKRLEEWKAFLFQLEEFSPAAKKVIVFRLERWLKGRLANMAVPLTALGGMLRDLLPYSTGLPGCSPDEEGQAKQVASGMIASLEQIFQDGDLDEVGLEGVLAAVIHAAMDLAERADRTHFGEQVPINDTWGMTAEMECGEEGHMIARWLRAKLPTLPRTRALVFRTLRRRLELQLAQEARHLRRLHMAFQQAQTTGLDPDATVSMQENEEQEIFDIAQDLVDELVMVIGNTKEGPRSILDVLHARGTASSSSAALAGPNRQGTLAQEMESLRRWLNEVFEGELGLLDTCNASGGQQNVTMVEEVESETDTADDVNENDTQGRGLQGSNLREPDETGLMQEGKGSRRGRSRSRSRSRGRTWSSASSRGWWLPGGTGFDGNAHRPWRREDPISREGMAGAAVTQSSGTASGGCPSRTTPSSSARGGRETRKIRVGAGSGLTLNPMRQRARAERLGGSSRKALKNTRGMCSLTWLIWTAIPPTTSTGSRRLVWTTSKPRSWG